MICTHDSLDVELVSPTRSNLRCRRCRGIVGTWETEAEKGKESLIGQREKRRVTGKVRPLTPEELERLK